MTKRFHDDIIRLKQDVLKMGSLACDMLQDSVKSLEEQDIQLAEKIISKKEVLADMDNAIELYALKLLTLHQPMAIDIRTIGASLKIITYLTRIGRYGKDIARIAILLSDEPHFSKLVTIPTMYDHVRQMIQDALTAYSTNDATKIEPRSFSDRDDDIDAHRYSIFRECISYMIENPKTITRCMNYIMTARYLERCGDNACKIAEKAYYMIKGERVEIS